MTGPLDTGTWRWARSCATWMFDAPLSPGAPPAEAIAACARGALAALPGFASPAVAEWTTASAGDGAAVQPRGAPIDAQTVDAILRAHPDLIALTLALDLAVAAPDGSEATLADAAVLHIELEDDMVVLWLSLHVDLYARRTFGAERDNDPLAGRNAPRLSGFLARLVETTGMHFDSVSAPSYDDQATPRGFA